LILLVDIGNTRLKWAYIDRDQMQPGGAVLLASDFLSCGIEQLNRFADFEAIWVSSVASRGMRTRFTEFCTARWNCQPIFVKSEAQRFGVRNGYSKPETLGVDRWMALLGAQQLSSCASCVVDCGTAITVDVLDEEAQHLGGLIVPGLHSMRRALTVETAAIEPSVFRAQGFLGADTESAIANGTLCCASEFINAVFEQIKSQQGDSSAMILTGGDARIIANSLRAPYKIVDDLVLRGLKRVVSRSL